MKHFKKLLALLIIPLSLTSCGGEPTGYDVVEPEELGNPVTELTIPNADGELIYVTPNLSNDECLSLFSGLKSFRQGKEGNYDAKMVYKSTVRGEKLSNAYFKQRITNINDKNGYFAQYQSGGYNQQSAATSPDARPYSGYWLETYGNKTLGFYGRINCKEYVDDFNNRYIENGRDPILSFDPDYPAGYYTKKGVETHYNSQEGVDYIVTKRDETGKNLETRLTTQGNCLFSCRQLESAIDSSVGLLDYYRTITIENNVLTPVISYQMTDKYLIADIEKPYGIVFDVVPDMIKTDFYERAVKTGEYCNIKVYYDVSTGNVAYLKADFNTIAGYPNNYVPYKGTLTLKRQPDSDEGYTEYLRLRNYIVKQSNQFEPEVYTPRPTSSEPSA